MKEDNCPLCGAGLPPNHELRKIDLWEQMVDSLEKHFPKLNQDNPSLSHSGARGEAMVMLAEIAHLFHIKR